MITKCVHIPIKTQKSDLQGCRKGSWLILLHARRIPPHVGLSVEGVYNSLTVKGHELNIPLEAVYKAVTLKKVESVFMKVAPHPVFSPEYQLAVLQELIKKFPSVKQDQATCLSPIKEFFQEFYAVPLLRQELLFDFIRRLNENNYLELASALNMDLQVNRVELPCYSAEWLNEKIRLERLPFHKD